MPRPQLSHFILFCFFSDAETLWAVTQLRLVIPKYPALISSSVFSGWDAGSGQPSSRRAAVQPKRDAWSVSQEAAEQQQQPEEEKKKTNNKKPGARLRWSWQGATHLHTSGFTPEEPGGAERSHQNPDHLWSRFSFSPNIFISHLDFIFVSLPF